MAKPRRAAKRLPSRGQRRLAPTRHTLAKQSAAVLALGLGLAAGAPAEASPVYTDFGATIINDNLNFLEHSGTFQFNASHYSYPYYWAGARVTANNGGYVVVNSSGYVALLRIGTPINASSNFIWGGATLGYAYNGVPYYGDWPGKKGYLGLQFQDADGNTHYGWAKLELPGDLSFLKLYGYAYETDVDTQILAGAGDPNPVPLPGSLALLASGAAGLLAYRRMRQAG